MYLWTLFTGLIFVADIFAIAQIPATLPAPDPNVPFVVAERILTPIDIDGKHRIESPGLMRIAKAQAERNATTGNYSEHTVLDNHVAIYGVMAENVGWASDWGAMYRVWNRSPRHEANRNGPFPYIGYHMAKGATGNFFVVVYGSRKGNYTEVQE
jgi:hypothetical protein